MAETSLPDYSTLWAFSGDKLQPTLSKISTGWEVEIPPRQWFNWLDNRQDQAIQHLIQHGIPVWSAVIEYQANKSYVQGSNGVIYVCKVTNTNNNPVTDSAEAYWQNFSKIIASSTYAADTGTANNYAVTYSPSVNSIADGLVVRFVAANANTGASTFSPNGLTARPILGMGNQPLQGGEILAGSRSSLVYNQALSSWVLLYATGGAQQIPAPSAGLHAVNQDQANLAYATPVGTIRNAMMRVSSPSQTATFTADEVVVETLLGGQSYRLSSFSQTLNLGTVGLGGMDTGTAPANGYVAIYAIYNPTTKAKNILAFNATSVKAGEVYSGSNMPSGFTSSALISVWATNGSGQLKVGTQRDRKINIPNVVAVSTNIASANFTTLSISPIVPLNTVAVGGVQTIANSNGGASMNGTIASDIQNTGWKLLYVVSNAGGAPFEDLLITTPQTIYYSDTGCTTYVIYLSSYSF